MADIGILALAVACILVGILIGWRLRFRAPGRYVGRICAIGRIQDKIPSMDGGKANMTAYSISMTNSLSGDLSLRIFKRDNPLWSAFESSGPSDHWIIEARRVKRVKRRVASIEQMKEGLFHDNKEPTGAFDAPWS